MNYSFIFIFIISQYLLNKNKKKFTTQKQFEYNNFADCRTCYDIKNYYNVLSNLIFVIGGLYHLYDDIILCICSILVGIGSSYYHLNPNMDTLIYDRIPMLLSFIYLTLIRIELNFFEQFIIVLYSMYSLIKWKLVLDIIPYASIQLTLIIYWLLFPSYNMQTAIIFYLMAKICEDYDYKIYILTNKTISGHTIKHLLAGTALFFI